MDSSRQPPPCLRIFPEGGADPHANRRVCTKGLTAQPTDFSAPINGTEEMVVAFKRDPPTPTRPNMLLPLADPGVLGAGEHIQYAVAADEGLKRDSLGVLLGDLTDDLCVIS